MTEHPQTLGLLAELRVTVPSGHLLPAVQRALDLVAFGLQAAESAAPAELTLPTEMFGIVTAEPHRLTVDDARTAFRTWVLGNGFRDCVDAIGPSLEWARKILYLWSRPGTVKPISPGKFQLAAQLTGEEWNKEMVDGPLKFDRLTLTDKFSYLERQYGFTPPDLARHILSLNAARNCLTHRSGVVGQKDVGVSGDGGLKVQWRRLRGEIVDASGGRQAVAPGVVVEAGGRIEVGIEEVERTFPLGSRIEFTPTEFSEICLTFSLFVMSIEHAIAERQQRVAAAQGIDTSTDANDAASGEQAGSA